MKFFAFAFLVCVFVSSSVVSGNRINDCASLLTRTLSLQVPKQASQFAQPMHATQPIRRTLPTADFERVVRQRHLRILHVRRSPIEILARLAATQQASLPPRHKQ